MTSLAVLTFLLLLIPTAKSITTSTSPSTVNTTVATGASSVSTATATGSTVNTTLTSMSTSNMTSNFSSSTENTTASTPITTTPTTTTTTVPPKPDIPHGTDITLNVLKLTVSNDNNSDIQYQNANLTRNELLSKLNEKFSFSFSNDLVMVNNSHVPAMYVLEVSFRQKDIVNKTDIANNQLTAALNSLISSGEFAVPNRTLTNLKIAQFLNSTMDPCAAENVCPVGYNCLVDGCRFMCSDKDCSSHGTCYISVTVNATASPMCQCDSEYATEYMGDNCQYSRRGRLQIIAIIAGVLGAACLVLIIIIIVLCIKYNRTSPSSNYDVSTAQYSNSAYDGVPQK